MDFVTTLQGFASCRTLAGFNLLLGYIPRVVAALQPVGCKLANAFGVLFLLHPQTQDLHSLIRGGNMLALISEKTRLFP